MGFFRALRAGFEVGVSKLFSSAEETDSNGISSWLWRYELRKVRVNLLEVHLKVMVNHGIWL